MQIIILVSFLGSVLLHKLSTKYPDDYRMRAIGMALEDQKDFDVVLSSTEKLLIESHFDLSIAVFVQDYGFDYYNKDFAGFFDGGGDIVNVVL